MAGPLDSPKVGPVPALRVEVLLPGDVGLDRGAEVFCLLREERPPGCFVLPGRTASRIRDKDGNGSETAADEYWSRDIPGLTEDQASRFWSATGQGVGMVLNHELDQ
jgi:hypothetical protein